VLRVEGVFRPFVSKTPGEENMFPETGSKLGFKLEKPKKSGDLHYKCLLDLDLMTPFALKKISGYA
jgi:hypothetical protein